MVKFVAIVLLILMYLGIVAVCMAVSGFIFMWLWNFVMPPVFGLPVLTYLQALALTLILGMVGGFFKATVTKK